MVKHQQLKENAKIKKNLEPEAEKNNTKKDYYIIITTKQSIIQEAKDISLNSKT